MNIGSNKDRKYQKLMIKSHKLYFIGLDIDWPGIEQYKI